MFTVEESPFRRARRQIVNLFGWAATFLAAGFLILYALAQFDDEDPIRFVASDDHVTTAADGRSFFVTRTTCVDRDKPAEAMPRLIGVGNNLLIPLPQKPLSAVPGCREYRVLVQLPDEVPPGEYRYLLTYRFTMNPFHTHDVQAKPVTVTVTR